MRRIILYLLAAVLLFGCFAACSKTESIPEPAATVSKPMDVEEGVAVPAAEPEDPPLAEPEPEEAKTFNPLTGEELDHDIRAERPFLVMINNIIVAQPQVGISQADMIYELMDEGGITRMMAIFTDIRAVEKIGSIRSARLYNVSVVNAFDGIFVHAGGSDEALWWIEDHDFDNINALVHEGGSAFYRDTDRQSHGVEHSLFGVGEGIYSLAESLGYRMEHRDGFDTTYGLTFRESAADQCTAGDARYIQITYAGGKATNFTYHEDTGLYTAEQFGSEYADDGQIPAEFTNVLVINADTHLQEDGLHLTIDLSGCTGNGYFACGGKYTPIQWSREKQADTFHYYTMDGEPLDLGVGKTFVAVQQVGGYAGQTEFLA